MGSPESKRKPGPAVFNRFFAVILRCVIGHDEFAIRRLLRRGIGNTRPDRSNDRHHDHGVAHRIA